MIHVVAHRGWWETPAEQNTLAAFARAFDAGMGAEVDVRDFNGTLVVSHDPPVCEADEDGVYDVPFLLFRAVLDLIGDRPNVLAVNVKSCGLAPYFAKLKPPTNWFFFDLPPHEDSDYSRHDLPVRRVVISAELYGHDHLVCWESVKRRTAGYYLLTDKPREALEYFK